MLCVLHGDRGVLDSKSDSVGIDAVPSVGS
jgi:hypothetical protein